MKQFFTILAVFAFYCGFSQAPFKPEYAGKWTEIYGLDSSSAFKEKTGYKTYVVDTNGHYHMTDSSICNYRPTAVEGLWELSDIRLIVNHYNTECMTHWPPNIYMINWVSKDLFYSVTVSGIDAQGIRQYSVFKRIR